LGILEGSIGFHCIVTILPRILQVRSQCLGLLIGLSLRCHPGCKVSIYHSLSATPSPCVRRYHSCVCGDACSVSCAHLSRFMQCYAAGQSSCWLLQAVCYGRCSHVAVLVITCVVVMLFSDVINGLLSMQCANS